MVVNAELEEVVADVGHHIVYDGAIRGGLRPKTVRAHPRTSCQDILTTILFDMRPQMVVE